MRKETRINKIFLFKYLKRHISLLILGGMLILILSVLLIPIPFLTKYILDTILPEKNFEKLVYIVFIVLFLLFFQKIISFFQNYLFYKINAKIIYDIKLDLLKKINNLPIKTSKEYSIGYLISRINSDTGRLRSLFADTIIYALKDVFTFIVGLGAIFYLHWKLALLSVSLLPFFIIATIFFGKKIRNLSKIYYEDDSQTTKQLEETLAAVELVKQFSRQNFNILRYLSKARISFRSSLNLGKVSFINSLIVGLIGGIAPIVIIGYGGYEIINDRLTIGALIAFNSFIGYLFGPANRLINVNIEIQKAVTALNRVVELFNLSEQNKDNRYKLDKVDYLRIDKLNFDYGNDNKIVIFDSFSDGNSKKAVKINLESKDKRNPNNLFIETVSEKKISLENINFNSISNKKILSNLSLQINSGEKIGIVGRSGSGKTTLLKILSGLYEIEDGDLIVNNKKLNHSEIIALRKYIAVVEQEPFLFNDSIYNNIKFGKSGATDNEIFEAAKKAHVEEFVSKLPEKYYTSIGNKGNNLSVGQKQRIAIARALIKNPKILILDEATSSIDNFSEKYIIKTIKNLPKDMIVIIAAHRLSTIKNCDKIFVLDKGTIQESGTHDELLNSEGLYYKLHNIKSVC